jgi:hypothetical protein
MCHPGETVQDLKQHIQDKEGIPPDQQRLLLTGQHSELEDEAYLDVAGLQPNCELVMVLKLVGC